MTTTSSSNEPCVRTNWVFMKPVEISGKVATDQSGRFPTTSRKGKKYLMVLHEYESNAILSEPMKNCSEAELVRSYTTLHEYLCLRGLKPTLHVLDNECPSGIKKFMTKADENFQLVPPHCRRTNHAKKAIGTFKEISTSWYSTSMTPTPYSPIP